MIVKSRNKISIQMGKLKMWNIFTRFFGEIPYDLGQKDKRTLFSPNNKNQGDCNA